MDKKVADHNSQTRLTGLRILATCLKDTSKLPLRLFIAATLTGMLTGFICAFFEIIPAYLNFIRVEYLSPLGDTSYLKYAVAFVISAILGAVAIFLTKAFAPEAGGSGIPEIEGALINLLPVRFWRVLSVKFFGGICSLSSGMVLGREGPSIQIGGNLGALVSHSLRLKQDEFHILLAAGAASGLASAFNAPLAGVLFVLEELRPQFKFSKRSVCVVFISVIVSTITRDNFSGVYPVFDLPGYAMVDLKDLYIFVLFGIIVGVCGVMFNKLVGIMQNTYQRLYNGSIIRAVIIVAVLAGCYGILSIQIPEVTGSGMRFIPEWIVSDLSVVALLLILVARLIGILLCFSSGIPGGIFAPSLALGTLLGSMCAMQLLKLDMINFDVRILAIIGMGAFFAASVRAPVTGIILVCEMTNNFEFLLPMMCTVISASYTAALLNGKPIYTQILERTIRNQSKSNQPKKLSPK